MHCSDGARVTTTAEASTDDEGRGRHEWVRKAPGGAALELVDSVYRKGISNKLDIE
jgi:hypothetical protein